jgi:adenylate cyclase
MRGAVKGRVAAGFADLGEQRVKNIAEPVRAFKLLPGDPSAIAHAVVAMDAPVPGFGGRPAIAVLPFDNLSADADQQYFADGLAEDILTRLAAWRWLPVIARNSSFTYRGRSADVKEVGRALGARYVLEGSVRRAGERLRVTGQLIDATNGHHLWAEKYDRKVDDLFAIQDEITDSLCAALQSAIGVAEIERARIKPPASLDAWEAVARGEFHLDHFTRDGAYPIRGCRFISACLGCATTSAGSTNAPPSWPAWRRNARRTTRSAGVGWPVRWASWGASTRRVWRWRVSSNSCPTTRPKPSPAG